ncbi:MAG: PilZ domain-containing protein [Deltaproteobacteria bacterium]|nr:PilZ domain-containing protein [Deltaproteobacteria bacterium]
MSFPPSVLLLDDGELCDVRRLLDEIGVDFVHLRGASISDGLEPPRDLLLTTSRRAQTIPRATSPDGGVPVRVVVANEEAETLRERLRRDGVDFLVRRPVHSEALRLLVLRSLYRGPEKRRGIRVPFGVAVECRVGAIGTDAVLAELSTGGCRLVVPRTPQPLAPVGAGLVVTIPPSEDVAEPLSLYGTVLRTHEEDSDEVSLAIGFGDLDAAHEAALAQTLLRRAVGHNGSPSERREHPRRLFDETITALNREASSALVGRDVSLGGMRVDAHPDLKLGDELVLEIYGLANSEPSEVHATVVRDDGPDGFGLRFDHVTPELARRLEELVTVLPSIEPLGDGESAAMGTVLSRIIPES